MDSDSPNSIKSNSKSIGTSCNVLDSTISDGMGRTAWYDSYKSTQDSTLHMANELQGRLESLNGLVVRRSTVIPYASDKVSGTDLNEDKSTESLSSKIGDFGDSDLGNRRIPSPLSFINPDLVETEAGRRLETLFDKFQDEGIVHSKRQCDSKSKHGLSRLEAKRRERRKKAIQSLQSQLENNSSMYLARAANSVHFKVKLCHTDCSDDEYPIPVGGHEMNPELLLSLSCEKTVLDRGRQLMKSIVLHKNSLNLFVLMYWFVHCRFFQKHSVSEQRYLLMKVAAIFPQIISIMSSSAILAKQKKNLFRHYPFIISKAIYLGFKYLCPGNHGLFKGAFERILNLSVFRLLTGVNVCSSSVDVLRLKLYPDDAVEDDSSEIDQEKDNQLRPMPSVSIRLNPQTRQNECGDRETNETNYRRGAMIDPSLRESTILKARYSILKFMGERDTLYVRQEKPLSLGDKLLPRQKQVPFDTGQISPLLQQFLGRDGVTRKKKKLLNRTEPVLYCRTGGIHTYSPNIQEINQYDDTWGKAMTQHNMVMRKLRKTSAKAKVAYQIHVAELSRRKVSILKGEKSRLKEFASVIAEKKNAKNRTKK